MGASRRGPYVRQSNSHLCASSFDPSGTFVLPATACKITGIRSTAEPVTKMRSWSLPPWKRKAPLPATEPISTTPNQPFRPHR